MAPLSRHLVCTRLSCRLQPKYSSLCVEVLGSARHRRSSGFAALPVCGELLICVENQQFATRHTQECRGCSRTTSTGEVSSPRFGSPGTATAREAKHSLAARSTSCFSNPVYIGEIRHRKERHPGQHAPIMEPELWERAQHQLRDQAARCKNRATKAGTPRAATHASEPTLGEILLASSETVTIKCRT